MTWTRAAGGLGQTKITALAACSDGDRTIVDAATIGGLISGSGLGSTATRVGAERNKSRRGYGAEQAQGRRSLGIWQV